MSSLCTPHAISDIENQTCAVLLATALTALDVWIAHNIQNSSFTYHTVRLGSKRRNFYINNRFFAVRLITNNKRPYIMFLYAKRGDVNGSRWDNMRFTLDMSAEKTTEAVDIIAKTLFDKK